MVRHVAAHLLAVITAAAPGREVQRLYKAPAPQRAERLKVPEVAYAALGIDREGEKAGVRRDDHVRVLPALERERGTAVRLVAVVERAVERVERAFGYAPGLARPHALFLRIQAEFAALIDEAAPVYRQKKLRHEVFKHCPRPAREPAVAVLLQLRAAEPPPVAHRHVALGARDVACQHRLARHQVVPSARAALVRRVVADVEQPSRFIIERGEVHLRHQGVQPRGKLILAVFRHGLPRGEKPGVHVAAVYRGDIGGQEGEQRRGVVPVIKMPHVARHALKRVEYGSGIVPARLAREDAHVYRRRVRREGKPDICRRRAPREPDGRLLLKIIRREKAVLRGKEAVKVPEAPLRRLYEIVSLVLRQLRAAPRRERQRERRRRGQKPHQPRALAHDRRGERQQRRAQQHGEIHRAYMPQKPRVAAHLGGGLPLQQPPVRHRHAPQRRRRRRQRYPRLIRQQPQPDERLHYRAACAREYARVAARTLPAAAGERRLRQREHQPRRKRQQRRPCRDGDGRPRHEKARADRKERCRGDETAPQ